MKNTNGSALAFRVLFLAGLLCVWEGVGQRVNAGEHEDIFVQSSRCQVCHNGMRDESGKDLSMGVQWRSTVMAHSAVDPYWQASVRRETVDHPTAKAAVEDKCATCHMPMARMTAIHSGAKGVVLAHRPDAHGRICTARGDLAGDGVSCSVCHQITNKGLGKPESFTGGFHVDVTKRNVFGPFDIEKGIARVMESATGYKPGKAAHIREAALCGTCHTLYTHSLDKRGKVVGKLAEQMPYLEWLHSDYGDTMSCQDCHMPAVPKATPIASVLGAKREGVKKHQFRGGNALLLAMLGKHGRELGVKTAAAELESSRRTTEDFMRNEAAELDIHVETTPADRTTLRATVSIENLAGHKLPTAYPSRRVWLHVRVEDNGGDTLFESGAPKADGAITGNDNDRDGGSFEPHYDVITTTDQVQIYEAILGRPDGAVTTGLLETDRYLKDNRVVPSGFDKQRAGKDIAVTGKALQDANFKDGEDRVTYVVPIADRETVTVSATLLYQSIGHRWAMNLKGYAGPEPDQFAAMYTSMPSQSRLIPLASKQVTVQVAGHTPPE